MNGHKTSNHRSNIPRNNHKRNIKFVYDTLDWRYNRWIIFIAHDHHMTRIVAATTTTVATWSQIAAASVPGLHAHSHSLFLYLFLVHLLVIFLLICSCIRIALILLHVHAYAFAHRCVIYWIFLLKYSRSCVVFLFYFCWKIAGSSKKNLRNLFFFTELGQLKEY